MSNTAKIKAKSGNEKAVRPSRQLPKAGEVYNLEVAVGSHYGKRESGPCKISMPVEGGERNTTTFWMFPKDPEGNKRIAAGGGDPDFQPKEDTSPKTVLDQNRAMLNGLFDFEKGWNNFLRYNKEVIDYPGPDDHDKVVEFLLGQDALCSVLRFQSQLLATALVKADEGNSVDGSEKEADHAGTQSKRGSDSPTQ